MSEVFRAGRQKFVQETPFVKPSDNGCTLSLLQRGSKFVMRAVCHSCGAKQEHETDRITLKQGSAVFQSLGWDDLGDERMVCPNCVRTRSTDVIDGFRAAFSEYLDAAPSNGEAKMAQDVRAPTMKELRLIMNALESHFVDGVYVGGKSDASVAAELDLPRKMVEDVRIEAFGHIKNRQLDALEQEFKSLRELMTSFGKKLAEIKARS